MCSPLLFMKYTDFARFLLAHFHIESLTGKISSKDIRTALQMLPTGSDAYDHAYKDAIERIEGQHKEQKALAKRVISWITCTKRPLTIFELQHALAVEVGMFELDRDNFSPIELMVSVCAGLVTIDEENGIIRLVHYTTQEYFERTQKHWFPDAETNITKICLTYLSFSIFESGICQTSNEFRDRLESNRLYSYAAQNWGHHARMSSIEGDEMILDFLKNKAKFSASTQAMCDSKMYDWYYSETQMTKLHVTAYFGLTQLTGTLLDEQHKDANPNITDGYSRTPLHYAVENGHQEVVKLLLDKDADPNIENRYSGRTPLQNAVENGHQEVVKLLLDKDADPNIESRYSGQTPLQNAVENGHQEVVKLLLDKDADPNIESRYSGQTPLHYAVENGHQEVVKLLLDKDADPNIESRYSGQTPLQNAVENGYREVVKLLLDKDADPYIESGSSGRTPLQNAVENGHQEMVKLLLDRVLLSTRPEIARKEPTLGHEWMRTKRS
jgi:ankyrin repeat protein